MMSMVTFALLSLIEFDSRRRCNVGATYDAGTFSLIRPAMAAGSELRLGAATIGLQRPYTIT